MRSNSARIVPRERHHTMHDLETIKRRNAVKGVGDKLGKMNGSPVLRAVADMIRQSIRDDMEASRRPLDEREPVTADYFGDFYGNSDDYETNLREKAHADLVRRGLLPVSPDDVNIHD